jgi:hypothetical protein
MVQCIEEKNRDLIHSPILKLQEQGIYSGEIISYIKIFSNFEAWLQIKRIKVTITILGSWKKKKKSWEGRRYKSKRERL